MGKSAKRPAKRRVEGDGRVTPKKSADSGPAVRHDGGDSGRAPDASSRYTPPIPAYQKASPPWVPVLMFTLWGLGFVVIILNYMGLVPGGTNNWYLVAGLGFILGGIITATQYR